MKSLKHCSADLLLPLVESIVIEVVTVFNHHCHLPLSDCNTTTVTQWRNAVHPRARAAPCPDIPPVCPLQPQAQQQEQKIHSHLMMTDLGAGQHEVQQGVHPLQGGEFLSFPLLLLPPHLIAAIMPNILPPSPPFSAQTPHSLLSLSSSPESQSVYAAPRQSHALSPNEHSPRHSALSYSRAR